MATERDINPVTHLTTGAIGPPGKRVFYLQARSEAELITLIVEKQQVQSLAVGLEEFLAELYKRMPGLREASADYESGPMWRGSSRCARCSGSARSGWAMTTPVTAWCWSCGRRSPKSRTLPRPRSSGC